MPTPRRLTLLVLAATITSVSVIAAPTATGQEAAPISEREARRIVEEHLTKNQHNNDTLDIEGQAAIEAPPIRTIDDALFREYKGRGETTLGEDSTITDVDVWVPDQSSYPLMFLAREKYTSPQTQGGEQLLLFVKPGADDPWRTTMAVSLTEPLPRVTVDKFGLAGLVKEKATGKLKTRPASLAKKLAKLWTRSLDDPLPASATFEPGLLTTTITQVLVSNLNQMDLPESSVDFKFSAAENQPICFATRGGAFCFFVMSVEEDLEPSVGRFTQPDGRTVLGGLITPGDYGGARYDNLAIMGAFVPNRSRKDLVRVIGFYDGVIKAEGTTTTPNAPVA